MRSVPYLLRRPLLAGALLFVAVLAVRRALHGPPAAGPGDVARFADGREAVLRGRVAVPPDRRGRMTSLVVEVSAARWSPWGPFVPAEGRVLVAAPGRRPPVEWGDDALFWGRLKPLRGAAAPGAYDEARVWGGRGVFCRLAARPAGGQALRPAGPSSVLWWATQARRRAARALARLPPEARAVAAGLLLGEKPAGLPAMQEDFRRSGTIHLLVASGTNVAFVLSLWWVLARWLLFLPRRAALALGIPVAFFYALVAGAEAPVMRAAVMAGVGLAGLLLGRVDRPVHLVGAAGAALLAVEPGALFQPGFQLSFAATLGLALGMPAVEEALRWAAARPGWPRSRATRLAAGGLTRLFAAGVLSQLALAPLLILHFQRFSWAGLFANLAAVPWSAVCVTLAAGLVFVDVLCPPLAGPAAWAAERAMDALRSGAGWAARWPGAEVSAPWTPLQAGILGAGAAAALLILARRGEAAPEEGAPPFPVGRGRAAALLAAAVATAAGVWPAAPRRPRAEEVLWPAGAGDAWALVRADGSAALVGAGAAQARAVFAPFLRARGARAVAVYAVPKEAELPGVLAALPGGAPAAEELPPEARRLGPGAVAVDAAEGRFLIVTDLRAPPPAGPWSAAVVHPRGPAAVLSRRLGRLRAGRWVLRGRGGAAWEKTLSEPVHRTVRDGWLIRRGGRWETPEIVKS